MRDHLHIIGAGPVGALLALVLARRGFTVEVWERRPDLRLTGAAGGRSINLAVSTRGLHALQAVGLEDEVLTEAVPMRGRMMHAVDGALTFLRYGRNDAEGIHSMSRGGLNQRLLTAAEATGRVRLHFDHRLVDYDFASQVATFADEAGCESAVVAPTIFGADGSASALRTSMARLPGSVLGQEVLPYGYKELTIPPRVPPLDKHRTALGTGHGDDGRFHLEPHALHIWPRGPFMLIALPNRDGSFTCTLFLPLEGDAVTPSFARLPDAAAAAAFFATQFPDAVPLLPDLGEVFAAAPLGHMVTVKCWPWHQKTALLLGDASHAIVPFFGQGMNSGFEDCMVLDDLLAGQGPEPDWPGVMAAFSAARKPNTDAIADMAVENFVEMRDKVADPAFLLQKAVESELQKRHPGQYLSRYQLVTFTRVPYRVALEAGELQAQVLADIVGGAGSVAEIDWQRADALVRERVLPYLREHGVG